MTLFLSGSSDDNDDDDRIDTIDRINGKPVTPWHYSISSGEWNATPEKDDFEDEYERWLNSDD